MPFLSFGDLNLFRSASVGAAPVPIRAQKTVLSRTWKWGCISSMRWGMSGLLYYLGTTL